jgi:ribosomal protein S18 acetylase RimI-like enzyme
MLVAEGGARTGAPGAAPPLVGAVLVRLYDTPADPAMVARRRAHIEALIVDQNHRRAGVGSALMNAVTTWARDRGAEEVVLTVWSGNEAAAAFYQRLGYRRISQALGKAI